MAVDHAISLFAKFEGPPDGGFWYTEKRFDG